MIGVSELLKRVSESEELSHIHTVLFYILIHFSLFVVDNIADSHINLFYIVVVVVKSPL